MAAQTAMLVEFEVSFSGIVLGNSDQTYNTMELRRSPSGDGDRKQYPTINYTMSDNLGDICWARDKCFVQGCRCAGLQGCRSACV